MLFTKGPTEDKALKKQHSSELSAKWAGTKGRRDRREVLVRGRSDIFSENILTSFMFQKVETVRDLEQGWMMTK